MATAVSGTLSAGSATSVTVDAGRRGILITNTSQQGVIYVRAGGTAATVAGSGCLAVTGDRVLDVRGSGVVVSLISSGTPTYAVEALD